jgi:hypothetical protein
MANETNTKVGEVTFLNRSGKKEGTPYRSPYTSANFGERKPDPKRPGYSPMNNVAPFNKGKYTNGDS